MKPIRTLLLIFTLLALLVACGGDDTADTADTPAPADTAAQNDPPPVEVDIAAGEQLFNQNCSACHGPDAKGLPSLGKDLTSSAYTAGLTDAEYATFVKSGRSISDPKNTTGIDMPAKGGNPALNDEQLAHIIGYIRTLEER